MTDSIRKIDELSQYLRQMRFPVMVDRLVDLYSAPLSNGRNAIDILEEIITEEYQSRRFNTIQRHLKQSKLSQPQAHVDATDYSPSRKLNKDTIDQLRTCQVIVNHRNVIIQGATGTGKSYITNALSRHVIEEGYTAKYARMYDLLSEMLQTDLDDKLPNYLKKISKLDVLVIDDFLRMKNGSANSD